MKIQDIQRTVIFQQIIESPIDALKEDILAKRKEKKFT